MKNLSIKLGRQTLVAAAMMGIVSCASGPTDAPKVEETKVAMGVASETASSYLQQAQQASGETQLGYMLLAARAYLNQNQPNQAKAVLAQLQGKVPESGTYAAEQRLLKAKLAIIDGDRDTALQLLQWPSSWSLPTIQWQQALQTEIELHLQNGDQLQAAFTHQRLSYYLSDNKQANWDGLWLAISAVDIETIHQQLPAATDATWRGWLELSLLAQTNLHDPSLMLQRLAQWQQYNPAHPASIQLPSALEKIINVQPYRPAKVAVLLPLSGRLANQARALQDGLLTNLMAQTEPNPIEFIDTGAVDAAQAYQQALDNGAEFIIGPLLKSNVDKVLDVYQGEVPLLALNHGDRPTKHDDLYFFALSPEEEAKQAAIRMQQQGLKYPLVIASDNAIGERMASSFAEQWLELTEEEAEIHRFNGSQTMRTTVQEALHVDQSNRRISAIKRLFGNKTEADFRSRRDVDSLYLVTSASEVRLLKPFVDISLSVFADPLALYSSSRAHGSIKELQSAELQGLQLSDMPWLLQENPELQQASALWPERSLPQLRLYAMGYDSLSLVDRLAQMRAFTGYRLSGLSGQLTASPDGTLERHLEWARYHSNGLRLQQ